MKTNTIERLGQLRKALAVQPENRWTMFAPDWPAERSFDEGYRTALVVTYIGHTNTDVGIGVLKDAVDALDRIATMHRGAFEYTLNNEDEIPDIQGSSWAEALEEFSPYEERVVELAILFKQPLASRGIRGDARSVSFLTRDGYYVSYTCLDTQQDVPKEVMNDLLSGKAVLELMGK